MDLGDTAVLGMPQGADQGDDVEAELVLREGVVSLLLGTERDSVARAPRAATATDLEPEPDGAVEGGDGPSGHVGRPERFAARGAGAGECGEIQSLSRLGAATPSGHGETP